MWDLELDLELYEEPLEDCELLLDRFPFPFVLPFAFLLIHEIGFIGQGDLTLGKGGIVGLYVLRGNR